MLEAPSCVLRSLGSLDRVDEGMPFVELRREFSCLLWFFSGGRNWDTMLPFYFSLSWFNGRFFVEESLG